MHTNGIVIENETYGLSPRFAGFFLWHCWRHSNKVLYYELCFWWHQKRNHKITNSMCCVKAIEPFKIPLIVYYFSPSFFTLKRHFAALWIGSFMLLYLVLLYVRRLRKFDHTLVYRIDVHARLLILRKKSPLHSLILVCTFIDFEKKFPPALSYFGLHVYWF